MKQPKFPDKWYHLLLLIAAWSYYRFFCDCELCTNPSVIYSIFQSIVDVLLIILILLKGLLTYFEYKLKNYSKNYSNDKNFRI